VIGRTQAWGNQDGELRWCTQRRRVVVEFWLALANATIVCGRLIRRAWTHYRWNARPQPPTGAGLTARRKPGSGTTCSPIGAAVNY